MPGTGSCLLECRNLEILELKHFGNGGKWNERDTIKAGMRMLYIGNALNLDAWNWNLVYWITGTEMLWESW